MSSAMSDVWSELGATMRSLRENSGMSLRQVETTSRWGRGTLSQVENGKSRPARELVAWYDEHLGGDGLLSAIYAEARVAGQRLVRRTCPSRVQVPGDAIRVAATAPALGTVVAGGSPVEACWTLTNTGSVTWIGRRLTRFGTLASPRLITSAPECEVPTCVPGRSVEVRLSVTAPTEPASVIAYWQVTDGAGRLCFPDEPMLAMCLVVT